MPTIEARVTEVKKDGAWYRIKTEPMPPGAPRIDTQDEDKGQQAARLMASGSLGRIAYTQTEGKINERTGRPFQNFYWEHGEAIEESSAPIPIEEVAPREYGWKTNPEDAWRMSLAKGGDLAVATLPFMPEDQRSFDVQKRIARAWATFFFTEPHPGTNFGNTFAGATTPTAAGEDFPF